MSEPNDDPAEALETVDGAVVVAPVTTARRAAALEAQAGGRAGLASVLLTVARTRDREYFLGMLEDPRKDRVPLETLMAAARVSLPVLLDWYSEAKLSAAQAASRLAVAETLPEVAASVMARGRPHKQACQVCDGVGSRTAEPSDAVPNPAPRPCGSCGGSGLVLWNPAPAHEKLALELGGLLARAPGVAVNVNQTSNVLVAAGGVADSVDAFARVTDRVLYGAGRAEARRAGSGKTAAAEGDARGASDAAPAEPAS